MNKLNNAIALVALSATLAVPTFAQNVHDQSKLQNPEAADQSSSVGQGAITDNLTNKPSPVSKGKQKRKQKQRRKSSKEGETAIKSGAGSSSQDVPDVDQGQTIKPEESQRDMRKKNKLATLWV